MMSKENIRYLGETLLGSLYQKFESMCQEVDDIVNQEHRKVLENSFQDGECSSAANAEKNLQQIDLNFVDKPSSSSPGFTESFVIDQNFHSLVEEKKPITAETEFIHPLINLEQSVKSKSELEDGEWTSVANAKQLSQQIDLHYIDISGLLQLEQSKSFSINQDCGFLAEEFNQPSQTSDPIFTDSFLTDQNSHLFAEEKQPISVANAKQLIDNLSNPLSGLLPLTQSERFSINQDCSFRWLETDIQSFTEEKQPICDDTGENSDLFTENDWKSLFHTPQLTLPDEDPCDSSMFSTQDFSSAALIPSSLLHENSPRSEVYVKEEMIPDINHIEVEEENSPCSIMTNTVTYPLLHFSEHTETESQISEAYTCLISLKDNIGTSQEFTEVPINSPSESEGLKLRSKHDESCVFVQNDTSHTDFSAMDRYWRNKKKIRNPFAARKKLEKEYKRLSLWYCDIDAEFDDFAGDKLVRFSDNDEQKKNTSGQDLQDSEWEFV